MAHKNALSKGTFWQKKFEMEAKGIAYEWLQNEFLIVNHKQIFVKWFSFVPHGYKCMVGSTQYDDIFFEITKNHVNGEVICNVYTRRGYFVKPGTDEAIILSNISQNSSQ